MIQIKDVVVIPVSDETSATISAAMVTVFRGAAGVLWDHYASTLNAEDPRTAFSLLVTGLTLQAEAINQMVDLILEPGATPMCKVSRAVREEVRKRVREVFRETLDA